MATNTTGSDVAYRPLLQDDTYDTLPARNNNSGSGNPPKDVESGDKIRRESAMLNAGYNKQVLEELHYVAQVINPRARMHNILLIANTFLLLAIAGGILIMLLGMNRSMNKMNDNMNEMLITMKNMNDNMMTKMDRLENIANHMVDTMTHLMTQADTHALNVIYNTYQMCNVMTVGLEKNKGCRIGFGFPNGVPTQEP